MSTVQSYMSFVQTFSLPRSVSQCSKHVYDIDISEEEWHDSYELALKGPEKAFYSSFGRMLAETRRKRGISQEMLADELGLSRTSITNIEKGRQPVQLFSLYRIARLLRTDVKDLLPSVSVFDQPEQSQGLSVSRSEWLENMNVVLDKPAGENHAQHRTTSGKTTRG